MTAMTRVAAMWAMLVPALSTLAAQQVVLPGRAGGVTPMPASLGSAVAVPFADEFRLPDGRMQWVWRFDPPLDRLETGGYGLRLEIAGDVPVQLVLYRIENLTGRETLVDRRDLGDATVVGENVRLVTLTRPGSYILSATTVRAEASRPGAIHMGFDAPVQPRVSNPRSPDPKIEAIDPKPLVSREAVFRNLALSPTRARFGEHVSIVPEMTDLPAGCTWGAASVSVEGLLPPGLRLTPNSFKIEGTPRRPGTWTFTYSLRGLTCAGSSTSYGDRSANVTFTVLP
jgi:hypothetical protein